MPRRRQGPPNDRLRAARARMLSPTGSGQPMSRQELADEVNRYLRDRSDPDGPVTANQVGKLEQGVNTWPRALRREAYRAVLGAASDAELGFFNIRRKAQPTTLPQSGADEESVNGYRHRPAHEGRGEPAPRGARQHRESVVGYLDEKLGAGGRLLARSHALPGKEVQVREDDAMRRRTVLGAMTGLAFGTATPAVALEVLRHGLAHAIDADADDWAATADDYAHDFYTTPPADLIDHLGIDLTVLQHLIAVGPSADLLRVAAQMSVLMAMSLVAMGRPGLARRWWRTARRYADDSRDTDARILVRSWAVTSGGYERRPLPQIIGLADEAASMVGGRATAAIAGLHAGRAQALALAGRPAEAIAAVRLVEEATAGIPAEIANDVESLFAWPEHRLRHTQSYVYTLTGELGKAAEAQERAFTLYPASQARLRTQVGLHQAACLIKDGDIPGGLRHAADMLDQLPGDQHNAVLQDVAQRVMAAVPAVERGRPEAEGLRARLAEGTGN
jgi:hypothetical protein